MSRKAQPPAFRRSRNPVTWLLRHAQMSLSSLGRLSRSPISTLMTATVIGIALALPGGLHLLVNNISTLSSHWEGGASISLFLTETVSDAQAKAVRDQVLNQPEVAEATLISRTQALDEFRRLSGFGQAIDLLDHNPLPPVVIVRPVARLRGADAVGTLANTLQAYREIDLAQVDLQWVERLAAITRAVERGVYLLAGLLAGAVLLIVGNTIRLEIQGRRTEIEIVKLVGGTDAFIRRPFLYDGLWYGLIGALIALLLVGVALYLLNGPVHRLAGLYESDFSLALFHPASVLVIGLGGPILGLLGAALAVSRHLSDSQPE